MNQIVGSVIEGTVVRVYPKYAILLFDRRQTGLLHISELSNSFVHNFSGFVQVGNIYKVKVIGKDEETGFLKVSLKRLSKEEKRLSLPKRVIPPEDKSFTALEQNLPQWITKARKEQSPL